MKKVLSLMLAFLFATIFVSCDKDTIENVPIFRGFLVANDLIVPETVLTVTNQDDILKEMSFQLPFISLEASGEELSRTMLTNTEEVIFVTLEFINYERDTFVELVLNDSQEGNNQVYSTSSSINPVIRVDTVWDDAEEYYLTEIELMLPMTESETGRTIEITEVVFLRELINNTLSANLEEAFTTTLALVVSPDRLPTSDHYFEFIRYNDVYLISDFIEDYPTPETIMIPSTHDDLPVAILGDESFKDSSFVTVILPESITDMGLNTFRNCVLFTNLFVMAPTIPDLDSLALDDDQHEGMLHIFVPDEMVEDYQAMGGIWFNYSHLIYPESFFGETKLATPTITLSESETPGTYIVSWNAIDDAEYYVVFIFTFTEFNAPTYEIEVYATEYTLLSGYPMDSRVAVFAVNETSSSYRSGYVRVPYELQAID